MNALDDDPIVSHVDPWKHDHVNRELLGSGGGMDDKLRTKYTEIEVPLGAFLFDVPDPYTKADWTDEDEAVYFAANGWSSLRALQAFQSAAVEIHESGREIKAAAARGEVTLSNRQERSDLHLAEMQDAARLSRALLTHLRVRSQTKTAARSFATFRGTVRRTTPRRLGARRHRRAATRRAAAASDDSGPSDPPLLKTCLAVGCGGLAAGFAIGALAATVLR